MTRSTLKLLATAAAVVLPATGALAGGYIPPVVEPAVVIPVVVEQAPMTWSGGYVGGTLGYACCGDDRVGVNPPGPSSFSVGTLKLGGPNLGLQLGYRWQSGNVVYGGELGLLVGNIKDSVSEGGYDSKTSLKRAFTAKLQGGYLVQPETLVFATAGVVHGTFDYRVAGSRAIPGGTFTSTYETTGHGMNGWTIGAGVEHRLDEKWSVKGEWEYMNFGKEELGTTRMTPKFHNFKIGVNYRF